MVGFLPSPPASSFAVLLNTVTAIPNILQYLECVVFSQNLCYFPTLILLITVLCHISLALLLLSLQLIPTHAAKYYSDMTSPRKLF